MEWVHKKDITTGLRPLFIVLVNAGVYSHLIAGGSYAKTVSDVKWSCGIIPVCMKGHIVNVKDLQNIKKVFFTYGRQLVDIFGHGGKMFVTIAYCCTFYIPLWLRLFSRCFCPKWLTKHKKNKSIN